MLVALFIYTFVHAYLFNQLKLSIMKHLCLSVTFLLALISCSNDNEVAPTEKVHEVEFSVSTLDVDVEPISRATVPASDILTNITYCVVNTSTQKVYEGTQTLTTAGSDFGTIKLWLPAGTYKATFFGYGAKNENGSASMYYDSDYNSLWINAKNKDSFISTEEVVIEQETDNVDINLTRLNGALVVRLKDEIPNDIGKIEVSLNYYPKWSVYSEQAYYEGNDGLPTAFSDYLTISNSTVQEYVYYVLPQTGRTITFTLYDKAGAKLGATSVSVGFYKNRRTIVEGNLLDIISQKPFTITVTDDWDEDLVIPLE